MKRNLIPFVLMAAAAAGAAGAAGATSGAGTGPTAGPATAPDTNAAGAEKPKRAPKNPDNQLDIINGRLPMPLVFLIRFKEAGQPVAATAKKYGTSVGKVFDINKGRNFGYVTDAYKPSAEEMAAAVAWVTTGKTAKGKSLKDAGGDPDGIATLLKGMGVATADEVAARGWATRVVGAKKDAPVAAAGAPAAAADGSKPKLF